HKFLYSRKTSTRSFQPICRQRDRFELWARIRAGRRAKYYARGEISWRRRHFIPERGYRRCRRQWRSDNAKKTTAGDIDAACLINDGGILGLVLGAREGGHTGDQSEGRVLSFWRLARRSRRYPSIGKAWAPGPDGARRAALCKSSRRAAN